ncbi:EndoU domain-containing protein, partial [Kitasatospora sp. NPDC002551]|uniref:EndoU domain-containing protein n=1 Tax=Kitasatospora sp. NPDC002551 TaxID=3154539 RepID=UPI003325484B
MPYSSITVDKSTADFFSRVTGMPWPEIAEGDLREVRDAYQRIAEELPELRRLIAEVANKARQQFEGQAARQFSEQMRQFIGETGGADYITASVKTAEALAKCANDVATAAEYSKWMSIAQLVQLLVEIALAILWAPFTFGASLAEVTLKTILTREVLKQLMKFLLKTILLHTFAGIMSGLTMDLVIQNIQIGQGNRKEIDKDALKQAVLFGVIGGVISGPLNLIGMGLGKLLGRLLGRNGGRIAADKLTDFMINGDRKALKEALEAAGKSGLKGVTAGAEGGIGKIGAVAGKSATEGTTNWLDKSASRAFARDLGKLLESSDNVLRVGFEKAGSKAADRFSTRLSEIFEKHLGGVMKKEGGSAAAKALGKDFGELFVTGWGKNTAEHAALKVGLKGMMEVSGDFSERGVGALARRFVDIAEDMPQGNRMFHIGYAIGEQLKEGVQGNLVEGFYNLFFSEKHEFTTTLATFGSGMAMGLMARGLHHAASPVMSRYMDWVRDLQFSNVKPGDSKYFPPYHPLTVLAVLSNLSGNPAPLLVPRLGAHVDASGTEVESPKTHLTPEEENAKLFRDAFGGGMLGTDRPDPATMTPSQLRGEIIEAFSQARVDGYGEAFAEALRDIHPSLVFGDEDLVALGLKDDEDTATLVPGDDDKVTVVPTGDAVRTQSQDGGSGQGKDAQGKEQPREQGKDGSAKEQQKAPGRAAGDTRPQPPVRTSSEGGDTRPGDDAAKTPDKDKAAPSPTGRPRTSAEAETPAEPVQRPRLRRTASDSDLDRLSAEHATATASAKPEPEPLSPPRVPRPAATETDLSAAPTGTHVTTSAGPLLPGADTTTVPRPDSLSGPVTPLPSPRQDRTTDTQDQDLPNAPAENPVQPADTLQPAPAPVPAPAPAPAPAHQPGAGSTSDLRPGHTTTQVHPPAGPRAQGEAPSPLRPYEARRGTLPTGERATELVLRLHLDDSGLERTPPSALTALRRRALEGVDETYNNGHRLPDGSLLRVRVEFVGSPDAAHHTVRLHDRSVRQSESDWAVKAGRDTLGHEIGRVLGLRDGSREVYRDGGADRPAQGPTPRRLRTVGLALDDAFAPVGAPAAPARPLVAEAVRTSSLYGSGGPEGTGGHLLRDSVRQAHADGRFQENTNRTVRLRPADAAGEPGRTFFPPHWTADESVYAAEQAFRDHRTRNPDATGPHWEGEYAGVRIVGEQNDGVITGFRPDGEQGTQPPPPYAPKRPDPRFREITERPVEFGDRRLLTVVPHTNPAVERHYGVSTETVGAVHENGTRRGRTWYLDPRVPVDSPAAQLPSRWHRAADTPDRRFYPSGWTNERVVEALAERLGTGEDFHLDTLDDGVTEHVVTEIDGVWVEALIRDEEILDHRPTDRQPGVTDARPHGWDDAAEIGTSGLFDREKSDDLPELGFRRVLFDTGQDGIEIVAKLHLAPGEGVTEHELLLARQRLQDDADALVASQGAHPPLRLRLDFTDDLTKAHPVVLVAGARPFLDDHLAVLLEADGDLRDVAEGLMEDVPAPIPRPVAGSFLPPADAPAVPPRSTDRSADHLERSRADFTTEAWERPPRELPAGWTVDDARHAAHLAMTGMPDREGRPTIRFAGADVRVRLGADGRITEFTVEPLAGNRPDAQSGPHRVLDSAEIRPPADAFGRTLSLRRKQSFEAVRIELPDGDTETVLRLRVHLDTTRLSGTPDPLLARRLDDLRRNAVTGVDEQYNRGQRLPNGDLLRVEVDFVDTAEEAHHTVNLHPRFDRADMNNWSLTVTPHTIAHELGHHLGLPDEYREASKPVREVSSDGSLMTAAATGRYGQSLVDMDARVPATGFHPAIGLPARYLRQLGSVVEGAFGPADGPSAPGTPPPRAAFDLAVRSAALFGGPGESGGHLYPQPGSARPRPDVLPGSEHRNGTFRTSETVPLPPRHLESAGTLFTGPAATTRTVTRTMFPRHWRTDDAVYAAEQAYHSARRTGRVTADDNGVLHWSGEYGGVRIEGEIVNGEFTSFRPAPDQDRIPATTFEPRRPGHQWFGGRADEQARFGDRRTLTGAHLLPPDDVARRHGVEVEEHPLYEPHDNGTYRARVWYLDPVVAPTAPLARSDARWFRRTDDGTHMMYPDHWDVARVMDAVLAAHRDRVSTERLPDGTEHWVGTHDGVVIEGITRDGVHLAHRPSLDQPISRWRDEEVVRRSAPTDVTLDDGSVLTVRHTRFADGRHGLEVVAGIALEHRIWDDAEVRQIAESGLQQRLDQEIGDLRTAGGALVRVVLDTTGTTGQQNRIRVQDAERNPEGLLRRLLGGGDDLGGTLTALGDRAPARDWTDTGRPTAPPLREPGTPGTGERPATTSRTADDLPELERDFALPADWTPQGSGLPAGWSRQDALQFLHDADGSGVRFPHLEPAAGTLPPGHEAAVLEHRGIRVRVDRDEDGRVVAVDVLSDRNHPSQFSAPPFAPPAPPQAPVHPAAGGQHAAGGVPNPNSPTALRPGAETRRVDPPAGPRPEGEVSPPRSYQVRRGHLLNGDPVTELVLRLHLDDSSVPADDAGRVAALRRRVDDAVAREYNAGHRLPDGNRLQVRVEFVDSPAAADHTVTLHAGTVRQDGSNWGLRTGRDVIGHEIGRALGLEDGPREARPTPGTDWTPRLRAVGAAVDGAFAPDGGTTAPHPAPARITDRARDLSLYGLLGEGGTGGSLLRPSVEAAFSGRFRTNANETVLLPAPIGSGQEDRTFFPRHWSTQEVLYAVEQAHLDARRHGGDSSPHWIGEYAGVVISGTHENGAVTGFRPHPAQGDLAPPPYAPRRPATPRAGDPGGPGGPAPIGDRRTLRPVHHLIDGATGDALGVRTEVLGEPHPNGTRRARTWYLDARVRPDSPLADFPSRWHRSAESDASRLYPAHWTPELTAALVEPALLTGRPRRESPLPDGRTRHVVAEADGVWVEGLVRDGQVLTHRPTERQPDFVNGAVRHWDDAPVLARSEPVTRPVAPGGPEVTGRRVVFATGQEGIELTVRLHLMPGQGMGDADLAVRRAELQDAADRLVAAADPLTPIALRLEFTDDAADAFAGIQLRADRPVVLEQHLRPLLDSAGGAGLETAATLLAPPPGAGRQALALPSPVHGSLRVPGTENPAAPPRSADLMQDRLGAVRESLADHLRERPIDGVPPAWTAEEARYAAHVVAARGVPDAHGVVDGVFAGHRVRLLMDGNRVTDVRFAPIDRGDRPVPQAGPHRVLATAEIRPPADAFGQRLAARRIQSFEATRIALPDGDTETVLRVRLHLDTTSLSSMAPDERERGLRAVRARAARGVDEEFNRGQRLPGGDLLRVEVDFVDTAEEAHHTVVLDADVEREHSHHWGLGTSRLTMAHEVGHLLGLPDEYREAGNGPARAVHPDGATMTSYGVHALGDFMTDRHGMLPPERLHPAQGLAARYLRHLGSVVDGAFGTTGGPAGPGALPRRANFGEDTLRTVLHGPADGSGGHLYPEAGSARPRPEVVPGSENRNGTFRVARTEALPPQHLESAGTLFTGPAATTRTVTRTMFPRHWTSDDAVYAAEQAYLDARRTGRITERAGVHHWTGEYGGVRIQGEVVNGEFTAFRPSANQNRVPAPAFEPPVVPRRFGVRAETIALYGDRQTLSGGHHRPDGDTTLHHGISVEPLYEPHDNGTYRARAWYLDPVVAPTADMRSLPSRWFRRADGDAHMMYPDAWTPNEILQAVEGAYRNRPHPRQSERLTEHWVGEHRGVRIEGITRDGVHLVHRPSFEQPISRWRAEEIVQQSAPRAVSFGNGFELAVRHVRFADGQSGLGIVAPVEVRFAPGLTPDERAAHRAALQRQVDQEFGNVRTSDGALVRVVVRLVESTHPDAHPVDRTTPPDAQNLLPQLVGDRALAARVVEYARRSAPAANWTDSGRPTAPELREPGTPGTDERPATISRTQTRHPDVADAFALGAGWTPRDSGLPAPWTREDAFHLFRNAFRFGTPFTPDGPPPQPMRGGLTVHPVEYGGIRLLLELDVNGRAVRAEVVGGVGEGWFRRPVPAPGGPADAPHDFAPDEHGDLMAPGDGDAGRRTLPRPDPDAVTTAPAQDGAAAHTPLARNNPWHRTEPDGTLKGDPLRPPAPGDGEWQEVMHNGVVRVVRAELDGTVEAGSPLALFPSRWSRSVLDLGSVHYPTGWTAEKLAAHVGKALERPVATRTENGVLYKLGFADGVWTEGMYVPGHGTGPSSQDHFLGHRPSPFQTEPDPRYRARPTDDAASAAAAAEASRGALVDAPGHGPVKVQRELRLDGSEVVRITARIKLVDGENVTMSDRIRAQRGLDQAAAEFLAGHREGRTRVELRLTFTTHDDATAVRVEAGGAPTLRQVLPRLHEAVDTDGPAAVLAALKEQAPPPPYTVAGETMLIGRRGGFAPAAWDNPTEGRHLPGEWTADEARYAASVVSAGPHRVPAGPVPPGGTAAPVLVHGEVAGVKLTVRLENGLITDFWGQPDQRRPDQSAAFRPERRRVIATREVVPPTDPFQLTRESRGRQRFTVTRSVLPDGDTESLLTVKVRLVGKNLDMTDPVVRTKLKDLIRRARTGMAEAYDLGQRLPNGDRLRVEVQFVSKRADAHHVVNVHAVQERANRVNWGLDIPGRTIAHELGHSLGLPDEYRERSKRPSRPTATDGGIMGATAADRFGRVPLDMDNHSGGTPSPRPVLRARNLRQLGEEIDRAFGEDRGPAGDGVHPTRPRVTGLALHTSLYGTLTRDSLRVPGAGRDGGGHLFPPPGSDRPRPERIPGSENRNGTFRVYDRPADDGRTGRSELAGDLALPPRAPDRGRTMFPAHWTSADAGYAAEQAYQHALRRGPDAFTELGPVSWAWTGEYGGVRIEGRTTVRVENGARVAEIVSFRPSDDQGGLGPAVHMPWRPATDVFGQRVSDLVRYGDRQTLSGVHHRPPDRLSTPGGVVLAGERMGIRIENPSRPNPNGTYRAVVRYLDPTVSPEAPLAQFPTRWHRRTDRSYNMFYPDAWTHSQVVTAVDTAYRTRNPANDRIVDGAVHWTGVADGVRIEGITRDGRHLIHRPAENQSAVGSHRVAALVAPLAEPTPPGTGRRPLVVSDLAPSRLPRSGFARDLAGTAGRGLPREWTEVERRYAAYHGKPVGAETRTPDGGYRVRVRFAEVEITVVRNAERRIVDFAVADGHTPPPQRHVAVPDPLRRQPAGPGAEGTEHAAPRRPAPQDEDGDVPRTDDEDDEPSDGEMSDGELSDGELSDDMDWQSDSGEHPGNGDAPGGPLMDLDDPLPPARVRPAFEAPAPDLRFAMLFDPAEVRPPANQAEHSSTSTRHRGFQAARGVLLDGRPAVQVVVRIHLDTTGMPPGNHGTELRDLRDRARQGIDEYYNTGHRLPDGDVLVVRAEFVDDPARSHHRIQVLPGTGNEHSGLWHLESDRHVLAHEFGHLLGLPDEYRSRRLLQADAGGTVSTAGYRARPAHSDASLMAGTEGFQGQPRIDGDAGTYVSDTSLRFALAPRNLRELGRAIEAALGSDHLLPGLHDLPRRASFGLDARRSSLEGDTRTPGGHLLVPAGSDR